MGMTANDRRGAPTGDSQSLPPVETALTPLQRIICVAVLRAQLAERSLHSLPVPPAVITHGS
jgi:hypothetical protein